MPISHIYYYRQNRALDVHDAGRQDEIIANESIRHFNYDDLRAKISARFKRLLGIQYEPLYDLACDYYRAVRDDNGVVVYDQHNYATNCRRDIYDSIEWELVDQSRGFFAATYYTLRGTENDSSLDQSGSNASTNEINLMDTSTESLHCVLERLDGILEQLI